jgi:hypothetical protein
MAIQDIGVMVSGVKPLIPPKIKTIYCNPRWLTGINHQALWQEVCRIMRGYPGKIFCAPDSKRTRLKF